ncbi:MAG TPA: PKD domain-containing protein [Acidimicrobiales bacterium]
MTRNRSARARLAAALVTAAVGAATLAAGAAATASASPPPAAGRTQVLAERMHGEAAIRALGDRLPDVAHANRMTAAELTRRLRADQSLWLDEAGSLLFVDDDIADHAEPAAASTLDPAWLSHTTSAAFTLHSRPGAERVIHLDFDGHDPSTSAWSDKTYAQPYDTDRSPSTFSDTERRTVIEVWQRMAEDFAPFAIDVTTEDPGIDAIRRTTESDARFGTRVVVTPTRTNCTDCGGVAYLGTYNVSGGGATTGWTHDRYQPAWVYPDGWSAKSIAEAASHEAGHNLGLSHDGGTGTPYYQGHGDWAPIMGVGYYREISQWSKGENAGATNDEDDLALVVQHGGPLAVDDHGSGPDGATSLASSVVDVTGEIGTRADVDAFSFTTTGGALTLHAAPVSVGANLDLSLRVVGQDGTTLATADPAGLSASVDVTVPAGTHTVRLDGVGFGDPATTGYSDYASVGRYHLTGLLPSGVTTTDNQAPIASLSASTTSGTAPLPVTFDSTRSTDADGDPLTSTWTFGDGGTATGATVSHTYAAAGTYEVTLTVSDGTSSSTASTVVTVAPAPTRPTKSKGGSGGGGGKPAKTR